MTVIPSLSKSKLHFPWTAWMVSGDCDSSFPDSKLHSDMVREWELSYYCEESNKIRVKRGSNRKKEEERGETKRLSLSLTFRNKSGFNFFPSILYPSTWDQKKKQPMEHDRAFVYFIPISSPFILFRDSCEIFHWQKRKKGCNTLLKSTSNPRNIFCGVGAYVIWTMLLTSKLVLDL